MSRENEPSVRFGPSPDPEDEEPQAQIDESVESGGAAARGQINDNMESGGAAARGQIYKNVESGGAAARGQIYKNVESGEALMRGQTYETLERGEAAMRGQIYETLERGGAAMRAPPGPQNGNGPDRFKLDSAGVVLLCLVFLIIIGFLAYYNYQTNQTTMDPPPGLCPDGWKHFRCSCFFVSSERKTWTESRDDCETRGARLVVIDDRDKNMFVRALRTDEELWIGLTYTERWAWTWVNDANLVSSLWEKDVNSVKVKSGSAAFITESGLWNHSVVGLRSWVCEMEI